MNWKKHHYHQSRGMQALNIFLLILILIGIGLLFTKSKWVPSVVNYIIEKQDGNNGVALCFLKSTTDPTTRMPSIHSLKMNLSGNKVKGTLDFWPSNKDKKTGKIEGYVGAVDKMSMTRTANLVWDYSAEGKEAKEEVIVVFGEGIANIGTGEMIDNGKGLYVYKDKAHIAYKLELKDVGCN